MITPGAFAANCSWSGQVLTIKRDTFDQKTQQLKALPPARGQVTWNNHAGRMLAFQQQVRDQTNSVVAAHVIAPAGAGGVSKAGGGMRQRKSSAPLRSLF